MFVQNLVEGNDKTAVPTKLANGLIGLCHLGAAITVLIVCSSDQYADTRRDLVVKGRVSLWLKLAKSDPAVNNQSIPTWSSVQDFVDDTNFHSNELSVCRPQNDDSDQFPNCSLHEECSRDSAWSFVMSDVESKHHYVTIPYGFVGLFVSYFALSAIHHGALATLLYETYLQSLTQKLGWAWRWVEYGYSAALMTIILSLLNGGATPEMLYQASTLTWVTMVLGHAIELCDGVRARLHDEYIARQGSSTVSPLSRSSNHWQIPRIISPFPYTTKPISEICHWLQLLTWTLFFAGAYTQFFGLWLHPWVLRFNNAMKDYDVALEAQFPGGVCEDGPPSWVIVAIWTTVLFYTAFAFVMWGRLRHVVLYPSYEQTLEVVATGEKWYLILSLLSKIGLATVFIWGTVTRTECETLPNLPE